MRVRYTLSYKQLIFSTQPQCCFTARKMSKYGVISGPYFPVFGLNTETSVFSPNTGKYGLEITPYLDTFLAVNF